MLVGTCRCDVINQLHYIEHCRPLRPGGNGGVRMAHGRHVQKYPIIAGFVTPIPPNLYTMPLCSWLFIVHVFWYTVVNVHHMSFHQENVNSASVRGDLYLFPRLNGLHYPYIIESKGAPYHTLKASERSRGLPPFITSAVNGVEGSTIRPGRCTLGEWTPYTNWIGYYRILLDWINRHKRAVGNWPEPIQATNLHHIHLRSVLIVFFHLVFVCQVVCSRGLANQILYFFPPVCVTCPLAALSLI